MTDRPILFSGPMVRAIWADLKTQTRRVLKPQPFSDGYYEGNIDCVEVPAHGQFPKSFRFGASAVGGGAVRTQTIEHRYDVGDRLWVRETWAVSTFYDGVAPRDINPEGKPLWCGIAYPATREPEGLRCRPGIHMPRWASRFTLPVVDVRVERLQDISEADAIAEGIEKDPETGAYWGAEGQGVGGATRLFADPRHAYRDLWDHLNEARGFGWDVNPWVVAVSFTVERRNIDVPAEELAA